MADADGYFEVEAMRGARLRLSQEGFAEGFVELTPARESELGTLVLRPTGYLSVSGCLIQGGTPPTDARVTALVYARSDEEGAPAPTTVSDARGCFRLDGIRPQRSLRLAIVTAGVAQSLDLGRDLQERSYELGDVDIAAVRRFTGRIVDAEGMPVPGASVWLRPDDSPLLLPAATGDPGLEGLSPVRTSSASDGRFELPAFAGTYTVFAFKRGLAPARARIHVADRASPTEVSDLILPAGIPLRGRVIDGAGAPLAGAQVSLLHVYSWGSSTWDPGYWTPPDSPVVTTDGDGCFVFPGMLPGMRPELRSELAGYVGRTWLHNERLRPPTVESPGPCGGATDEIEMARAGRIEGTVVDQVGRPVAGMEVFYNRVESVPDGARSGPPRPVTGPDGTFVTVDLVPGSYELGLTGYGYLHRRVDGVTVAAGETTAVDIEVTRIAERQPLDIRVLDHRGVPVPGARVVTAVESDAWQSFTPSPVALTGADGRVWFPDAPLGDYEIRADADGVWGSPVWRSASALAADDAAIVLRLPPPPAGRAFPVSGRLLDAAGEGVTAARLKLMEDEPGGEEREAISEAGGAFRFDAVPPGRYLLRAARRGFPEVLYETALDVVASGIEDVVVAVPVAGAIHGSVAGLPPPGAQGLRIDAVSTVPVPVGVGNVISGTGWVDENSEFRVTNLVPGRWRLRAETSSGRSAETVVAIERPGDDVAATLVFPPAFTLTGSVRWRGAPLASAFVSVGAADVGGGTAYTDDSGHFTIPELPAGRYGSSVSLGGTRFDTGVTIDLDADDAVDFEIRGGSVAGRLLDAESGEPVAGAVIRTAAMEGQGHYNWIDRTDPSGGFRTRPLAAGMWQLEIRAPGYAPRRAFVDVGNEDIDEVRIELTRGVLR
ncbi:MAG: carboxypeptidase-like regulatory domain-containing protein [Acidobacteriota bacterium]